MTENECIKSLNGIYPKWCSEKEEYEMAQVAIQALEEIQQYRAIGTVEAIKATNDRFWEAMDICKAYREIGTIEECKSAVERMKPKKPIVQGLGQRYCPSCGCGGANYLYCGRCGQKLGE